MNPQETQEQKQARLGWLMSFVNASFASNEEVAKVIKALIGVINTKISSVSDTVSRETSNLGKAISNGLKDVRSWAETRFTKVEGDVTSVSSRVGQLDSRITKTDQRIDSAIVSIRSEMPVITPIDENRIVDIAVEKSYSLVRPLIPSVETSVSIRNKLEQSFAVEKLDAKNIVNLEENIDGSKIKNLKMGERVIVERVASGFIETPIKDASTGRLLSKDASGAWLISTSGGTTSKALLSGLINSANLSYTSSASPTSGAVTTIALIDSDNQTVVSYLEGVAYVRTNGNVVFNKAINAVYASYSLYLIYT